MAPVAVPVGAGTRRLPAADGYPAEALAELKAVRPLLVNAFGPDSTQVRNLDKQAARLEQSP
jgi:hypothetical protein